MDSQKANTQLSIPPNQSFLLCDPYSFPLSTHTSFLRTYDRLQKDDTEFLTSSKDSGD